MKFTHVPVTSITVEKVENITTSMTRAGLGDDTYRRQRDKQRYAKFKAEQADRQQKMRDEFMKNYTDKQRAAEEITKKKSLRRQKKKQRQKQLKKKHQLIKQLGSEGPLNHPNQAQQPEVESSDSDEESNLIEEKKERQGKHE